MSALAATPDTDLLVWPETAIPYYIDESRPCRLTELGSQLPGNEFTRAFFSIQDVSYGAMDPGSDFTIFQIPGAKFSVLICYESVYPQLARQFRLRGANFSGEHQQ
jgi:apolipoprotein N-acyltransferase